MITQWTRIGLAACLMCGLTALAHSQQTEEKQQQRERASQTTRQQQRERDSRIVGAKSHRASQIIGMTVKNTQGKELGEVNDIVLDVQNGNVQYLAVSFGGFLGLGDKLFAIPMDAFTCTYNKDDDEYYLTVAVTEEELKKAPGFDQDNWPNFANERWNDEVDRYYEKYRRQGRRDRDPSSGDRRRRSDQREDR